mgnify:CR=1 FL=1
MEAFSLFSIHICKLFEGHQTQLIFIQFLETLQSTRLRFEPLDVRIEIFPAFSLFHSINLLRP